MKNLAVGSSDVGKRADIFVASKYPQFTRSSLSALFDRKMVTINGQAVRAASKLHQDDKVQIDETLLKLAPADIKLPIIYEDKDVVVTNKPAGVLTHSKGALNLEPTVATWLQQHLKKGNYDIKSSFPGFNPVNNRLGIVHRLDRPTSGVMICAKNEQAQQWLQKQFSSREVEKSYLAIVEGVPNPQSAIIDVPIERNPRRPQTFRVGGNGKPSQTGYRVQKTGKAGAGKLYSLLELNPKTGRTHQLRVHLKYIGHPIVGDHVYGHGGDIMYLHAQSLGITLTAGQKMHFKAPLPSYFNDLLKS